MYIKKINAGFSIADTGYPSITTNAGSLTLSFNNSSGELVSVVFTGVAAYHWQESDTTLLPNEPWDSACELFDSPWLQQHPPGQTLYSVDGLRHLRFNFNAWGKFELLCLTFSQTHDNHR